MKKTLILLWVIVLWLNGHDVFATSDPPKGVSSISLDGSWELVGYSPDKSQRLELTADVPGHVHNDLLRNDLIPDPFYRDNADKCQWVENWYWSYKKRFTLPANFERKGAMLEFDGLDTFTEIYLNGRKIGEFGKPSTENMFRSYQFNVNGWLKDGAENIVEVRFLPLADVVGELAKRKVYPSAFGDPIRSYVRRMQCTFGWDWVHRFVSMGIWRPCRVVSYADSRIDNLFIYTKELKGNDAKLSFSMDSYSYAPENELSVLVTIADPEGRKVAEKRLKIDGKEKKTETMLDFTLPNAQLWWPNGQGSQPLYNVTATLFERSMPVHTKSAKFGVRTVELEQIPDRNIDHGSSFTFVINGRRIFAKGGNWIPADPFPSRITKDRYRMLLQQAADAGMNMQRVWGGGIYESNDFLSVCDSLGIMIWHDFMLACGGYPEEIPDFAQNFVEEVRQNVVRMRNSPSIVVWCGDNELSLNQKPDSTWPFKATHTKQIAPMLAKLDPSRPFRLTSPIGNDPLTTNSTISGDAHRSGQYDEEGHPVEDYRFIVLNNLRARFLSESTTAGVPTKRTLLKFMTEDDLSKSEMFDYHTKDNPYLPGGLTLFGKAEDLSFKLYGEANGDNNRRLRQLEYIQYEFVRLAMEAARSNKFHTSGVLFWMYNDCWPASGWSHIDYWGGRKAAWYAMHTGSRPIIAATEAMRDGTIKWWITSDAPKSTVVNYAVKIVDLSNSKVTIIDRGTTTIGDNDSRVVADSRVSKLKMNPNKMVVFEINYGEITDRSFWTPYLPKEVVYPKTNLKITQRGDSRSGSVTISADRWARVVTLDGDADFSDNYFEMLPGETRIITWRARGDVDKVTVTCWNQ